MAAGGSALLTRRWRRLTLSLVQEVSIDSFDDVEGGPKMSDFNLLNARTTLRGAWRFLPKTSLFIELNQGVVHYLSDVARQQLRYDSFPLRLGVGLLGARITASQIAGLGWSTAAIVIAAVVTTLLCGMLLGRRLGMNRAQAVLSGGSVAICGASAALAESPLVHAVASRAAHPLGGWRSSPPTRASCRD
mgnify:CR=1 FL=1